MFDPSTRPAILGGLAAFALALAFLIGDPGGVATRLREEAFDYVESVIPPTRVPDGVVVVDIDRDSLAAKGPWPWRRNALGELVAKIQAAKARVIGIDILLDGEDRRAPRPILRKLAKEAGQERFQEFVDSLPDDDKELAEIISQSAVVLGFLLDDASKDQLPDPISIIPTGQFGPQDILGQVPQVSRGVVMPLQEIADNAAALGTLSLSAGAGGKVRSVPILVLGGSEMLAGFAVQIYSIAEGAANYFIESDGRSVSIGPRRLPLREGATIRLHLSSAESWNGRTVSASDVIDGKIGPERLADRVVLIGSSAPEAGAYLATAASPFTPTVQIHAETVEELRSGDIPQRILKPAIVEPLAAALLGLVALAAAILLGPLVAAAMLGLIMIGWIGFSVGLFAWMDVLVDPAGPLLPAIAAALTALLMMFARTRKLRSAIERKFGRYLSPEIVRRLTASPEELKIEGELREVTALFSDIEGFTTMSEQAEPRTLVRALDAYFEGVCAIVIRHGGMVDKIVGDAVHGLFNAPLEVPGHARAALDCAIEIGRFTTAFRSREDAQILGFGRTRIGFETGPVIVGDVGGLGHLDYTAHGDAVNSAARLEAINKQFGTTICLGARAHVAIGQPERLRPLGKVTLRGRVADTAIYSPWPDDTTPERKEAYLAAYAAMEDEPREARRLFEALARDWPEDPAVAYWIKSLWEHAAG